MGSQEVELHGLAPGKDAMMGKGPAAVDQRVVMAGD